MPWSGTPPNETFSRDNGTYTGSTVWAQDEAAAVGIVTDRHDTHDQDIAAGLNLALKKDGGNQPTANIPMGSFKLTGLAAGSTSGDSVRYEQVLLLAGGTMSGNIAMGTNKLTGLAAGSTAGDSVRYEQVLLLAGGTMAGNIAMGTNKLTGLAAGSTAGDSVRYEQVLLLAGGTMSGQLLMADQLLTRALLKDYGEEVSALGSGGGTRTFNINNGNVFTVTVSTSTNTFSFTNPTASGDCCSITLFITNGGSQTVNWPASVDWAGGTAPSLTAAGVDIVTLTTVDAGTTWYGFAAGLDMQ